MRKIFLLGGLTAALALAACSASVTPENTDDTVPTVPPAAEENVPTDDTTVPAVDADADGDAETEAPVPTPAE